MPVTTSLHFTPDGVRSPRTVVPINIALLTEGFHQLRWGDCCMRCEVGPIIIGKLRSDIVERLIQIGDDVFHVFDSNRNSHEAVGDSQTNSLAFRDRRMRHRRRV